MSAGSSGRTPAAGAASASRSRFAETSTRGAVGAVGAVVLMHRGHGLYGLGYWLLRAARGRGLASRAVALVAPWALAQPEVAGLEALVEPWNEASSRVVERGLLSVISGLALCGFHLLDARYSQPLPKAGEDFVLPIPLAGEPVLQRAASPGRRRGVAASR